MTEVLRVSTIDRKQVLDLTDRVEKVIRNAKMQNGLCVLFVAHTTAALTTGEVGEGTEQDFLQVVEQMIPDIRFRHAHNPAHAWSHMAASLVGASLTVPVSDGKMGKFLRLMKQGRFRSCLPTHFLQAGSII